MASVRLNGQERLTNPTIVDANGGNLIYMLNSGGTIFFSKDNVVFDRWDVIDGQLGLSGGALGTGNVTGRFISIGRNSSGNGAAGYIQLIAADGNPYYLWVDTTGDLRIGTAAPHEDGTPADTSGTVVGAQS